MSLRKRTVIQQALSLRSACMGQRVARGAGLQFMTIGLRTLLTIGSTAVLARLLAPSDFGYIAMATVVTEFAALFGAFGFTNVLIQRQRINRLQLDTVFWATLGVGALLSLAVLLLSFVAGWLFADAQVGPVLRVLCWSFMLSSVCAVPTVVNARLMRFHVDFLVGMGSTVLRIATALLAAWVGLGLWSLVAGTLAGGVFTALFSFIAVPYRPRLRFHAPLLTSTWRTSGGYIGNTALYYVNTNLDLLLIGRGLGATALGYYQNARSLTNEIRGRIAMPIQHVLFPAFSALQEERERFQQLVLRAARLLAAVVIPIGVGVSANAPELVRVLYGPQWMAMVPVVALFGLSAALRASTAISQPLFNANNRVGLALRYNLLGTLLMVGGVLVGIRFGIQAVALAVALSSLYSLVMLRTAFRLIGLGMRDMVAALGSPTLAAMFSWFLTQGLRQLQWAESPAMLLAGHVLAGGLLYLLALHLLSSQYLQDFRQATALMIRKNT
jgi:O-antigen/teichoic acid export membrane protein